MIHISEKEMGMVTKILRFYAPNCDVLVFGSRYKGNHRDWSDLDLAFIRLDGSSMDWEQRSELAHAFSFSNIPYKVDIIDYNGLSDKFRKFVDSGNEIIFKGELH